MGFVLVFEFMVSDLAELIKDSENPLSPPAIKSYMLMLLKGVAHLHKNNIMHRDLKPANLLISSECRLKIADFGLSRVNHQSDERQYSHQVKCKINCPYFLTFEIVEKEGNCFVGESDTILINIKSRM